MRFAKSSFSIPFTPLRFVHFITIERERETELLNERRLPDINTMGKGTVNPREVVGEGEKVRIRSQMP